MITTTETVTKFARYYLLATEALLVAVESPTQDHFSRAYTRALSAIDSVSLVGSNGLEADPFKELQWEMAQSLAVLVRDTAREQGFPTI